MPDPNPLAGMPLAESLANQMNESLQWMSRMWGNAAAAPRAGAESLFGTPPPGLPSMLMPTLDPNELDKRISDLRTVEHWLDMNRALLHSTIQTLQMQRDALVALQSMARSAQAGSAAAGLGPVDQAPAPAPAAQANDQTGAQPMAFNPAQWWNMLQEQFARVAAAAVAEPAGAAPDPQPEHTADPEGRAAATPTRRAADAGRSQRAAAAAQPPPEAKPGRKAP